MTRYKQNKGNILLSIILVLAIIVLVVFLAYQIIFEDILGIMNGDNPIDVANLNIITTTQPSKEDNKKEDINEVHLTLEETENKESEKLNSVSHHYYNQLDENAKTIYKGIEDNISNMMTGTYKIDFGTKFNKLLHQENGESKLNTAFQSAWNAFTYDHVEVFYIDVTKLILTTQTTSIAGLSTHKVYLSNAENITYLAQGFSSHDVLQKAKDDLSNLRNQVITILKGYSDYDKIIYLHDWMIDNIEYDTTYRQNNIYDIYGTLKNGKAVCEGYARAFKYMLDGLGIPSVLISGTATNSEGKTESHAWNYVQLEGKWYAVDLTWDDPVITGGGTLSKQSRYKYFLKGSNSFFEGHKENGILSENSIKFRFPAIERNDYEKLK